MTYLGVFRSWKMLVKCSRYIWCKKYYTWTNFLIIKYIVRFLREYVSMRTCNSVLVFCELSVRKIWPANIPYTNTVIYQQSTTITDNYAISETKQTYGYCKNRRTKRPRNVIFLKWSPFNTSDFSNGSNLMPFCRLVLRVPNLWKI